MSVINQSVKNEPINWDGLEVLIRQMIAGIPDDPMKIQKFSEGYSILTWYPLVIGKPY